MKRFNTTAAFALHEKGRNDMSKMVRGGLTSDMDVRMMRTEELIPYERNQKKHDEKQIRNVANSIRRFGWQQPIVIDQKGVIVIGHCRWEAAKLLHQETGGYETVPVVCADNLTEDEIRELRIVDNKTNESPWDMEALSIDVQELDFEGFEFDLGDPFAEKGENSGDASVTEDDFDAEPPEEPKAKLGDIYQLGRHRLMCGDSTNTDDVAKLMDGVKADVLLTDPPYGVEYVGKTKKALKIENDHLQDDKFLEFLEKAFSAADSVMKPGAVFYIWHADSKGNIFRNACFNIGWEVRQCLVWVKNSLVIGRQDYQWKHEPCLYGWKSGAGHLWASDRKQTTVLEFNRPTKNIEHPTMKPIALFDYEIRNNTKEEDVVLDLFTGSGTTMMACQQNGRTAYCMEFDPKYVDVIINRWEAFTGEKAVLLDDKAESC